MTLYFIQFGQKQNYENCFFFSSEHLLSVPLTVVDQFHSHLEPMEYIGSDTFQNQVRKIGRMQTNPMRLNLIYKKFNDFRYRLVMVKCRTIGM